MRLFKRVLHILTKHQRHMMVVLFVMMVIGAVLETIGTGLILPLVTAATSPDAVLGNRYLRAIYDFFHLTSVNQFLRLCVIALIIVYVLKDVYLYFMYYAQYRFVYNGQYQTSKAIFIEYVNRPYEFYLNASTPVVIRNIVSDVNGSYQLVLTYLQLFTEVVVFIALFALSLVTSPLMTLIMTGFIGLILLINKKVFGPILRRYGNEVQQNNANVTKWLLQAMNGMKETKVLNKEKYFVDQYDKSASRLNEIQLKQSSMSNVPRLSIETVVITAILVMFYIFLGQGDAPGYGTIIGQIAVLVVVAVRMMPSANRIATAVNNLAYYEPSLTAVEDTIRHAREINTDKILEEQSRPIEKIPFEKEVRLENITYAYPNTDVNIFENANLTIPIGKSIGIMGPSGAGKSTAVDIMLGLLTPQGGKITVDGYDIQQNLPGWYANIGYVPQMMFMLDDSIRANVAYGVDPEKVDDERVWACLKEAQMDEFVRSLPQGLDSSVGERGVRISGGQRQRIGIARALYNNPQVMIFDEATSALDNDTEAAIMDAIERLHGRKTLIIVAHRLTTIENCDQIYKVENQNFVPHTITDADLHPQSRGEEKEQ